MRGWGGGRRAARQHGTCIRDLAYRSASSPATVASVERPEILSGVGNSGRLQSSAATAAEEAAAAEKEEAAEEKEAAAEKEAATAEKVEKEGQRR